MNTNDDVFHSLVTFRRFRCKASRDVILNWLCKEAHQYFFNGDNQSAQFRVAQKTLTRVSRLKLTRCSNEFFVNLTVVKLLARFWSSKRLQDLFNWEVFSQIFYRRWITLFSIFVAQQLQSTEAWRKTVVGWIGRKWDRFVEFNRIVKILFFLFYPELL